MNNKILSAMLLTGIVATGFAGLSSADFDGEKERGANKSFMSFEQKGMKGERGAKHMKFLTDEEKTAVESMTDEEKRDFFETKKTEKKAEREVREAVIDALLADETLTADQETLRAEIIKERAEKKAEREVRKAEMEEMKTIMDKKRAGEELTEAEEAKLEEFKQNLKGKNKGKKGGKEKGMHR